jgi:hypothetical protein
MSSWTAEVRRLEAAQRREERDARKRQQELERSLKEREKLSALEQARLEVEAHQNALEVLLSVHKEQSAPFDWNRLAFALPPHRPPRLARHELTALLKQAVFHEGDTEGARALDERDHQAACAGYEAEFAQWERLHSLAQRVLAGEARAYSEAVSEFSTFTEISNLGSSIAMTFHGPKLVGCELKVNGREAIPAELKSLTAAGKLTVKTMPKAQFHEIYQDYVCGCVLRLAREVFALLPVETVLMTAAVDGIDSSTGKPAELAVLSVAIPRDVVARLDFENLDPSDALENFLHRGDVKASRKSGEFVPRAPLLPSDLAPTRPEKMGFTAIGARVRQFRTDLRALLKPITPGTTEPIESSVVSV